MCLQTRLDARPRTILRIGMLLLAVALIAQRFVHPARGFPEDAADAILGTAVRENVKLIVMGVQARGALDRLIFGSTTRRVMQAATCPVLSIRARHDAEPWPAWPAVNASGSVRRTPAMLN